MIKLKHTISKTNNKDKIYSEQNKGKGAFMYKLDTKESITDKRQENSRRHRRKEMIDMLFKQKIQVLMDILNISVIC